MREWKIGDAAKASKPNVDGYVFDVDAHDRCAVVMVPITFGLDELRPAADMPPCPYVPRERVEALHAAVTARLEQLDASRAATWYASEKDIFAACHSDLSEVAEALRLLLEVDHA